MSWIKSSTLLESSNEGKEGKIIISSGWIVINHRNSLNPSNREALATKKVAEYEWDAKSIIKNIKRKWLTQQQAIQELKWWFTKGKVDSWNTIEETANKEIVEEWGIPLNEIRNIWHINDFLKEKEYGKKLIKMFLYITLKEPSALKPTDMRHISAFFKFNEFPNIIESKNEKWFFLENREKIIKMITENITYLLQ